MAFNIQSWGRISSSANNKVTTLQNGTYVGAPNVFTYISAADTLATIEAADYFVGAVFDLNVNDFIYASGSDGTAFLTVATVSTTPPYAVTTSVGVVTGDVAGPASSTDNALVRFDGVTGKIIKNGTVLESNTGDLTLVNSIANASGLIATPSYTFTGDVDSGMWRSAANTVDFSTNAFRALQLAASPAVSVNYSVITASATGNGVLWSAAGTDADVSIWVAAKAAGTFVIRGNTNAGTLTLNNQANTFSTSIKAAAVAASATYTLPLAVPTVSGQVLAATTAGVMSWVENAAGTWVDQTGAAVTMAASTSYIANNAGLVTLTVPAVAAVGDTFQVVGQGAGGWLVQMNAGQTANLNSSATTVAGSLASANRYNAVKLVCTVANTTFTVFTSSGTITVA